VMAFSIILISLDSSEESVGTSIDRVILFGTIPTTVPATAPTTYLLVIHDGTPLIPTHTPTISSTVPTIPYIAPIIQYTSPFICTDSSENDTSERPPSFYLHRLDYAVDQQFLSCQGRVRPLPTHRLTLRYSADYSSSNHFTSNDSLRDSPSDSSSETSSDSHSDTSSDSSLRHSSLDHFILDSPYDSPTATSAGPSRKRPDYSSSNHFTSDDSLRDSPSDSSSETSSDSHSDTSSDSSLRHSSLDHFILDSACDSPTATSAGPSRKRRRKYLSELELQLNTYHGWIDEDVINHNAMVLKMIDSIYIPSVDSHQLLTKIFPLSLADEAKQWWMNEGDGKITVWEELVEKLFCKFYPESYDGKEEMLDEGDNWGIDPLKIHITGKLII
nr:hypothetical protein [Tanacetum cinerariifolium]